MRPTRRLAGLVLAMAAWSAQAAPPEARVVALQLLDRLKAGEFDAAESAFDARMREAVPVDRLAAMWRSLPAAAGRGDVQQRTLDGATMVEVPLHRAGVELLAQVVVGTDGAIRGFMVRPAPPPAAPVAPADAPYVERPLPVGTGDRALPGTLAMPRGAGPFPAVVLVHGSGPQDQDETIGANRPFLDLARGLAAKGIAVLRYAKRTQAHPGEFAGRDFTIDEETTDDAVAAMALLRTQPGIDARRVFVLGHSQGGMLAPRIATRAKADGMVMLAAPARRLLDLLPEQNRYLVNLDGRVDAAEADALAKLDAMIAAVRGTGDVAAADTPMGLPVAYWHSTDAVDPIAEAKAARLPMLLLQGARDFQVTATDWGLWTQAFARAPRATLRHYPALDHLGIAGSGPSTIASYSTPGHVDAGLVDDVAAWIAARR